MATKAPLEETNGQAYVSTPAMSVIGIITVRGPVLFVRDRAYGKRESGKDNVLTKFVREEPRADSSQRRAGIRDADQIERKVLRYALVHCTYVNVRQHYQFTVVSGARCKLEAKGYVPVYKPRKQKNPETV
jgi:hypothetical protein